MKKNKEDDIVWLHRIVIGVILLGASLLLFLFMDDIQINAKDYISETGTTRTRLVQSLFVLLLKLFSSPVGYILVGSIGLIVLYSGIKRLNNKGA